MRTGIAILFALVATVADCLARSDGPICSFNAHSDVHAMWKQAEYGGEGDPTSFNNMIVYLMNTGRWPVIKYGDGMGAPHVVFVSGYKNASIGYPSGSSDVPNPQMILVADVDWIKKNATEGQTDWGLEAVFAHELGHLLYQHTPRVSPEISRRQELEADEFAGYALHQVGLKYDLDVSLRDAQAIVGIIAPVEIKDDASHPVKADRLAAIARGWNSIASR